MSGPSWTVPAAAAPAAAAAATTDAMFGGDDLLTALLLSLGADRRAEDDDGIPDGTEDKRGWWGDQFAETEGDKIGSRRWLLDRAKNESNLPALLETYDREALAWLLEDKVARQVDVAVVADGERLLEDVVIWRPGAEDPATFKFAWVWGSGIELVSYSVVYG